MYSLLIHGRRSIIESHKKWGNFRVSVQNSSSFANSFTSSKLGKWLSKKVGNPESVLRSHGLKDSQISTIITGYPLVFVYDGKSPVLDRRQSRGSCFRDIFTVVSTGYPLEVVYDKFLQSRGAASTLVLTEIVSTVPKIKILRRNNEGESLSLYYVFVKDTTIEEETDKGSSNYETLCHSLHEKNEPARQICWVLRGLGVPDRLLVNFYAYHFQPALGKERFEEALKKVVGMGFDPATQKFFDALFFIFKEIDVETLEETVNYYKSLGFDVSDVRAMFNKCLSSLAYSKEQITWMFVTMKKCGLREDEVRSVLKKFPQCIGFSQQDVLRSIEEFKWLGFSRDEIGMMVKHFPHCLYYRNSYSCSEFQAKKGWPLKSMVSDLELYSYHFWKRIKQRYNVIKALTSKGLLVSELPPMTAVLACADEDFLNSYVRNHDDEQLMVELMSIFNARY